MQKMQVIYVKDEYEHYYRQCSIFVCEAETRWHAIELCKEKVQPLYIRAVVCGDSFYPAFLGYMRVEWRYFLK